MVNVPTDLFAWAIDDGINKPTKLVPVYTFDIEGTFYTEVNKPTNVVAFYSHDITRPPAPNTDLNLIKYSGYVFNATPYGVIVYDDNLTNLGVIELINVSCIGANHEHLYIGTTNSGIYHYNIDLVASGIFNQYTVFKQDEEITSNFVRYISCKDDYVLATTESGINRYDLNSDSWYKCYPEKEVMTCWQAPNGSSYYVTKNSEGTFYEHGDLLYEIKLTGKTGSFGNQVNIVFQLEELGYQGLYGLGYNLLFFDEHQNPYNFYLESWDFDGNFDVWVNIVDSDVDTIYMVLSKEVENKSNKDNVFLLYDDFTNPDSGKWDFVEAEEAANNLLFDGSMELGFTDFYNPNSENPVFLGTDPSSENHWNGDCTYMAMVFPTLVDGNRRSVFIDNNYNDGILAFYSDRIIAKWDVSYSDVAHNINVQTNIWYHVAMTHRRDDENDLYITKLYVNGEHSGEMSVVMSDTVNTYGPDNRLVIGDNFVGIISEVKLYDYVMDESEIQSKMHEEPESGEEGLVGYYKINQGEGEVIYDYSGNERHSSSIEVTWTGFRYEDNKLIQQYSSGYIKSTETLTYPCTVQQNIKISDALDVSRVYGVFLDDPQEGFYWYYNSPERTFDIYHADQEISYYNPENSVVLEEGVLTTGFGFNIIEFSFKNPENNLVDNWAYSTYSSSNRKLRLFGQGYESSFTENLFIDTSACFTSQGDGGRVLISGQMWNIWSPDHLPFWYYDFGSDFDTAINKIVLKQGWGGYQFGYGKISGSNDNINYTTLYEFAVGNIGGRTDSYVFLQNTTVYRYIRIDFTGDLGKSIGIETLGAYGYYDSNQHLLGEFDIGKTAIVELDWVRVINFGSDKISLKSIEEIPEKSHKKNELNVMYNIDSDWSNYDVDYIYFMEDGVYINDIHVTHDTSIYGGNVIFLANSDGIMCIEEKRGDESNCRVKYYKTV